MFNIKPPETTELDVAIDNALKELAGHEAHTQEYERIVDQLSKLYEISNKKTDRVSKDTMAIVLGNLAGILVIVGYESRHVVTTKALSFVGKFAR